MADIGSINTTNIPGGGLTTGAVWTQPHAVVGTGTTLSSNRSRYGVAVFADSAADQEAYFTIAIPTGATTISKAIVLMVAENTADVVLVGSSEFAADGEASGNTGDSVTQATIGMTAGQFKEYDITPAMTGIAANDYFGIKFERKGTNVADTISILYVYGLLVEYT